MIKPYLTLKERYKHNHIYSFKKFAWLPTVVYDFETKRNYKVWFDSYYSNFTALHGWESDEEVSFRRKGINIEHFYTLKPIPYVRGHVNSYYDGVCNGFKDLEFKLTALEVASAIEGE